jgi:autotransporter-associated beta strand protein
LTISNTSIFALSGSITGYSGAITLGTNVGNLRFNNGTNANNCLGSATASFNLGTGGGSLSNFNGAGLTYNLGALSGGANSLLSGRCSNTTAWAASSIYAIGANGQNTVFAGRIVDGTDTVSVVKIGTGTLALNGTNTYTGSTTVSNGTLAGSGVISGPVTITAAGTLAPGTSVGKLTVNNSVALNGTTLMELDRIAGVSTNDQLAANSITAGGALLVTNIGPGIFNGAAFKLFSLPVAGFSSLILPTNGPSGTYVWNNTLSSDGRITLVSGGSVNTNRPTITNTPSVGRATLTLTWPSSHVGWSLQAQTNTLGTNWFTISGSETNTSMQFTVDPANSAVFYRLVYP